MRARDADIDGFIEHDGIKIHFEVYGESGPTILLLPTWTLVHKRIWKGQVPYLARHHRVVVYDGPGNGRSDRPTTPSAYSQEAQIAYALRVLDAVGADRAVVVALSKASNWALDLAANHPERVLGTVLIGASLAITPASPDRVVHSGRDSSAYANTPSRVPLLGTDPPEHWAKYQPEYWRSQYQDFAWFFLGQCFPERHSTKQIEDAVGWAGETTAAVLQADLEAGWPDTETLIRWCAAITSPVLLMHGDEDLVSPIRRSVVLAELTGGELVTLHGSGHIPLARDPVRINTLIHGFVERLAPPPPRPRSLYRWNRPEKRVLLLSSPIGLGHARRDIAIAKELRKHHPDVRIDWLTRHPVTRLLEHAGEWVHPASGLLASESAHFEREAGEHDLHAFEALRRMDEILLANFMLFHDVVSETRYDLVIGDEAWDVDHFLHENPELKRFAYAWLTDFVGNLPMPDATPREALLTADYNAEMIEHIATLPRIRDRAIFVGNPDDVVPERFGPELPLIRDWTEEHYTFSGYITGFDLDAVRDRAALRAELGYGRDERVCVVTVGGSGVGTHLLRRVVDGYAEAARAVPELRMVVVTGPRIDRGSIQSIPGLEVHAFLPELYKHLAASDLAIVQGGLTTCMELTALGRPFIYVPLRHHFEQHFHVAHRLDRYRAGLRMEYDDLTPETVAEAIVMELVRKPRYRRVETDGAQRAAALLAALL